MKVRTITVVALGWMLARASIAAAQSPTAKPLPPPPAGFKVLDGGPSAAAMKSAGVADGVQAEKPNANWPKCVVDPKIGFTYGWTALPGADQTVEMMAQAPEDPPSETGGTRIEPAGKRRYKGGVLTWQKWTLPAVGTDCGKDELVTYHGSWVGYVSGKLLGVGVSHVFGSKETGQAWIDEYIDKLIAAVTGPK